MLFSQPRQQRALLAGFAPALQDVVLPMFQRVQLARQSQGMPVYQAQLNGDQWMDIAADKVARWKELEFNVRTLYTAPQAGAAADPGNAAQPVEQPVEYDHSEGGHHD